MTASTAMEFWKRMGMPDLAPHRRRQGSTAGFGSVVSLVHAGIEDSQWRNVTSTSPRDDGSSCVGRQLLVETRDLAVALIPIHSIHISGSECVLLRQLSPAADHQSLPTAARGRTRQIRAEAIGHAACFLMWRYVGSNSPASCRRSQSSMTTRPFFGVLIRPWPLSS